MKGGEEEEEEGGISYDHVTGFWLAKEEEGQCNIDGYKLGGGAARRRQRRQWLNLLNFSVNFVSILCLLCYFW